MKKKHLIIIIAIVWAIGLIGCDRRPSAEWPATEQQFDFLNARLDSIYKSGTLDEGSIADVEAMEKMARSSGDKRQKAMALYWKSMVLDSQWPDSAEVWLSKALEATDSTAWPYMHARISLAHSIYNRDHIARYSAIKSALDYFTLAHDDYMCFIATRNLGTFYLSISELEGYQRCNAEVERICKQLGNDTLATKSRMNHAVYYIQQGDSLKAAEILRELINSPLIRNDSVFLGRLYVNIGLLTKDAESLHRAIEVSPLFRGTPSYRATIEFAMARIYNEIGEAEKCDSMLSFIAPLTIKDGDIPAKKDLYTILASRSSQKGDSAQAYRHLLTAQTYLDSIDVADKRVAVADYSRRDDIKRLEREHARESSLVRIKWLAMLSAVLLVMLAVAFFYRDRQRKMKEAKLKAEAEMAVLNLALEKEKRGLAAMSVAMTERDNVIDEVSDLLDGLHQKGKLASEDMHQVTQTIRMSQSFQQEYAEFKRSIEMVTPGFTKRFVEEYPGVSDGDVKIALLISIGLSSKQIAQVLHIQPDSIKKNRQRLRQRMGLTPEQSLEAILRRMS